VAVPTIEFNLSEVVSALNAKVEQLQSMKATVQQQIAGGSYTSENEACLARINESLECAEEALTSLADCCCGTQTCFYEYTAASSQSS
jgi:hypothetical protein